MTALKKFLAGVSALFRKKRLQEELDQELSNFIDDAAEDKMRGGMPRDQALRAARVEMGSTEAVKDEVHDSGWESLLVGIWQDIRYGLRSLRKAGGFTTVATFTIALGIGATTVMFAVVDAVLIRPLPYKDANQLMFLTEAYQRRPGMSLSFPNFKDWRSQNQVFSSIAAYQPSSFTLTGSGLPEQVEGRYITHEWFQTLGVTPVLGRDFIAQDDRPSAEPVVMLSYELWQRRFSGDTSVIGRAVAMNGSSFTIIGVAPRAVNFRTFQPAVYVPFGLQENAPFTQDRTGHAGIYAVARLKSGVSLEHARQDMDVIAERLQKLFPVTNRDDWVSVRPLREFVVGDVRVGLLVLLCGVAVLLLIACGNVANLLLARASTRSGELAIRMALGASRARVVRQMLTESLLLATAGGLVGVVLAKAGTGFFVRAVSESLPRAGEIAVDGRALAFSLLTVILTGIVFGIAPALHASGTQAGSSLKESIRASAGSESMRLRSLLIVGELALSLGLLVAAGLLIRSFLRVIDVDPGFNAKNVLAATMVMGPKYADPQRGQLFFDEVMRNVRAVPGVTSAAAILPLPLSGNEWDTNFLLEGQSLSAEFQGTNSEIGYFGPNYLKAMRVPLISGREFTEADNATSSPVAIVNAEFAQRYWPKQDPIGKQIRVLSSDDLSLSPTGKHSVWRTVIGVIGNVKQYGLDAKTVPTIYMPFTQPDSDVALQRDLVIRTASDPLAVAEEVRRAVAKADRDQAISFVRPMEQYVSESLAPRELYVAVLGGFAASALLLAAIGIYGVISYWVAQRRREIGIRMALGAQARQILRLVLGRTARLIALGVFLGGLGSLALGRWMQSLLFGVGTVDAGVFLAVTALLAAVALLACYLPARRATKVDPNIVLRYE